MRKYSKIFAVLIAVAMILPGVAQAALVETTTNGIDVHRLGGVDRVGTAILASQTAYPSGTSAVVLAGYNGEVDALTGTLLAADKDAPLLITVKGELTDRTKDEIVRLGANTVYILGGTSVVSMAVETTLQGLGKTVVRVDGSNRDATAVNVAKKVKGNSANDVFLALGRPTKAGDALADALAIGPVSAMKDMPVLLTRSNEIPAETLAAMADLDVKRVTIIGGTTAIKPAVATMLQAAGYTVNRIGESGREETALKIAQTYFTNPSKLLVAYGRKSADALVGGYLGNKMNAPILLTHSAGLTANTAAYIKANPLETYVLGGTSVITNAVLQQIVTALEGAASDLTAYNAALAAVNEANYTPASWLAYQAIVAANVVTSSSSQADVDAAVAAIVAAQGALVERLMITSITSINGSQIEVKFNQPADKPTAESAANVLVSGVGSTANPTISTRLLSMDGKTLTLTSNAALNGKYSVEVLNTSTNKIQLKGNSSKSFEGKIEILNINDTTSPSISGVEYGVTSATVKFSEPLSNLGTVSLDGVVITPSLNADKMSVDITSLTAGQSYQLAIVGAKDLAGNFMTPNPATVTLTLIADTVKPTVSLSSEYATIKLDFSEKVKTTVGSLVINSTTVPFSSLIADPNDDTKYTYDATSLVTNFLNASVKVTLYQDLSGNVGDDVTTNLLLTKDTTPPVYVSSELQDDMITVKFNENVMAGSLTTLNIKYTDSNNVVTNNPAATVSASYVDQYGNPVGGGTDKFIQFKITEAGLLDSGKLKAGTYQVTLAAGTITDNVPNATTAPIVFTKVASSSGQTSAIVEVNSTTAQVANTPGAIAVNFNKLMGPSALNYANYKLSGVTIPSSSVLYFDGSQSKVRIELPEAYITASGTRTIEVSNLMDKDGNTLKIGKTTAPVNLLENVKPKALQLELLDGQNLKVTFSEKLDALPTAITGVVVKVNGNVITLDGTNPFQIYTTGTMVNIKAASPTAFGLTDTITVDFSNTNIKDLAGNMVKDITLTK